MRVTVTVRGSSTGVFGGSPQVVTADVRLDETVFSAGETNDVITNAGSNAASLVFAIASAFGLETEDDADAEEETETEGAG